MKRFLGLMVLLVCCAGTGRALGADEHPLVLKARQANPGRYQFAVQSGARIGVTADGRSFYILWYPKGAVPGKTPVIATIHGHGSYAFDEFFLWKKAAEEKGYGILAVQWWLGEGQRYQDYLSPEEVYRVIEEVFRGEGRAAGTALFHGFSRGSANSYAVAAYDNTRGGKYFSLFIANAGKPGLDFPSNVEIARGDFGERPLSGTRWVTYAGARDKHPDRDGYRGMREAGEWIRRFGGTVVDAIEDPEGDHGGFHRNPGNISRALDSFRN
ncbi:MAG TPA: hypothetical protein VL404_00935 [Candidatus Eisenbacteria bacterium]|nr:hypothetical protein [Candidatus Eisenbacteria bacterium]